MSRFNDKITSLSSSARLAVGTMLVALGAAGGAGAATFVRPSIEMAPTVVTPIAKLGSMSGIITIKGRVAEIYGDRALITDSSGKTMVDVGRGRASSLAIGSTILVQGRFDDGQLRGSFLMDPDGDVEAIGPGPRGGHHPGFEGGPAGRDPRAGPSQPDTGAAPAGCAPATVAPPPK